MRVNVILICLFLLGGCCKECEPTLRNFNHQFIQFQAHNSGTGGFFSESDLNTAKIVTINKSINPPSSDTTSLNIHVVSPFLSTDDFNFELNADKEFQVVVLDSVYVTIKDLELESNTDGGFCNCPSFTISSFTLNESDFQLRNDFFGSDFHFVVK